MKKYSKGMLLCIAIAIPAWAAGRLFPLIGGPILAILLGILIGSFWSNKGDFAPGIQFSSKKILQYAVILLGFGLNLSVIVGAGRESFPIILSTIITSLLIAYLFFKFAKIPSRIAVLIGVGSSICGGSAIAATAPIINAKEEEVAQAISVIFFFNLLAALIFPPLGTWLGFSTTSGHGFGTFAGTAVNDTSSVTAAASTWDSMYHLGSSTLDQAVTVKLTRTLAIIPITMGLGYWTTRPQKEKNGSTFSLKSIFPFFILFFLLAALITTVAVSLGVPSEFFLPMKELSKFLIIWAMAAIGLNTNLRKLIRSGWKPLILGFSCWISITIVSLLFQRFLGLW